MLISSDITVGCYAETTFMLVFAIQGAITKSVTKSPNLCIPNTCVKEIQVVLHDWGNICVTRDHIDPDTEATWRPGLNPLQFNLHCMAPHP